MQEQISLMALQRMDFGNVDLCIQIHFLFILVLQVVLKPECQYLFF